jgi:16S rRNA (cytosine967-C5)-methyltransferase
MDEGTGHCDDLLRTLRVQSLSPQDRNLCTNLVMGTLRWQIALDAQVIGLLSRPDVTLATGIRVALRLGAFQLLHLDRIPAHAAISESVELAKSGGEGFAAGMVNAVLRKIAAAGWPMTPARFRSAADLAAFYAHPAWMVERWARFYGMTQAQQICSFNQEPPPTTVRIVGRTSEDIADIETSLQCAGIDLAPGAFLTRAWRVVRGDITTTEAYRRGLVRIQDEGSQLVAELAGRGDHILDCCAAPGGKTAILAERNPGSPILACDVSNRRLEQMKRLLQGQSKSAGGDTPIHGDSLKTGQITFEVADAADLQRRFKDQFDLVLCDVPCSGTGTLARNPEIRHRMNVESLPRHQQRQIAILGSAMRTVAPGGRLVYATCSLEPEENEAVVEACLATAPQFRRIPFAAAPLIDQGVLRLEGTSMFSEEAHNSVFDRGYLRTIPGVHPCDGFFATLLTKA